MNRNEYIAYITNPNAIKPEDLDRLDQILSDFPYLQSARAVRLKALFDSNSFRYNYALKVTAAFTGDRSLLFDFITSDYFKPLPVSQPETEIAVTSVGQPVNATAEPTAVPAHTVDTPVTVHITVETPVEDTTVNPTLPIEIPQPALQPAPLDLKGFDIPTDPFVAVATSPVTQATDSASSNVPADIAPIVTQEAKTSTVETVHTTAEQSFDSISNPSYGVTADEEAITQDTTSSLETATPETLEELSLIHI